MTYKSDLGKLGEDMACEYLVKKGYKIIDRNFRQKWGELDIISKAPDRTLVFIEVKTMTNHPQSELRPEDQLIKAKLKKLQITASLYAGHYQEKVKDEKGWRIDLLALVLSNTEGLTLGSDSGQAISEENYDIKHYENIA